MIYENQLVWARQRCPGALRKSWPSQRMGHRVSLKTAVTIPRLCWGLMWNTLAPAGRAPEWRSHSESCSDQYKPCHLFSTELVALDHQRFVLETQQTFLHSHSIISATSTFIILHGGESQGLWEKVVQLSGIEGWVKSTTKVLFFCRYFKIKQCTIYTHGRTVDP